MNISLFNTGYSIFGSAIFHDCFFACFDHSSQPKLRRLLKRDEKSSSGLKTLKSLTSMENTILYIGFVLLNEN